MRTFSSGVYLDGLLRKMTELDRLQICARVKQARVEAGLTQEELADLLGVRQRTIANYEKDRVPWRYLEKIAEVTGRQHEWLLRGDEVPQGDLAALREELGEMRALLERLVHNRAS